MTKSGEKTSGTGAATITYTELGTLTWLFTRQFKVEFTCTGGDVNANKGVFRNCLIQGNRLTGEASATTNFNATAASYTYCCSPEALPAGEGNRQATVALNSLYAPRPGSAAVNAGSVDGYEEYLVGGTDLIGRPRVFSKIVDIGCCENQSGGFMMLLR